MNKGIHEYNLVLYENSLLSAEYFSLEIRNILYKENNLKWVQFFFEAVLS